MLSETINPPISPLTPRKTLIKCSSIPNLIAKPFLRECALIVMEPLIPFCIVFKDDKKIEVDSKNLKSPEGSFDQHFPYAQPPFRIKETSQLGDQTQNPCYCFLSRI